MATGLVIAAALSATAATYSAQRQSEMGRRAETRAKALAGEETRRQQKQEAAIKQQEEKQAKRQAGQLRATAGKRAGRRSLVTGPETGLAQRETLG